MRKIINNQMRTGEISIEDIELDLRSRDEILKTLIGLHAIYSIAVVAKSYATPTKKFAITPFFFLFSIFKLSKGLSILCNAFDVMCLLISVAIKFPCPKVVILISYQSHYLFFISNLLSLIFIFLYQRQKNKIP